MLLNDPSLLDVWEQVIVDGYMGQVSPFNKQDYPDYNISNKISNFYRHESSPQICRILWILFNLLFQLLLND